MSRLEVAILVFVVAVIAFLVWSRNVVVRGEDLPTTTHASIDMTLDPSALDDVPVRTSETWTGIRRPGFDLATL